MTKHNENVTQSDIFIFMISVEEALQLIEQNCSVCQPEKRPLEKCLNYILAEDVISPIDMPPFRQSAMDGYAINFDSDIVSYRLIGEIAAGSSEIFVLKKGEAVRIFTGSAVPESANVIAQQEIAILENGDLKFSAELKSGMNIRNKGEQISQHAIALKRTEQLNPAAIGFLATLGITEAEVYSKPKITILTTGSELVPPGEKLAHGQIFESNSIMISALLSEKGYTDVCIERVKDNLEDTITKIKTALETADVLLISGGISVGDYDFVKEALNENNVNEHFHKIRQKPGKPILFGTKDKKLIFALPGNPASALTCMYMYVLPALNKTAGQAFTGLRKTVRRINATYQKKKGMTHFLKSYATDETVSILPFQSSAMLNSFAASNSFIVVPEEKELINENDQIEIYLF